MPTIVLQPVKIFCARCNRIEPFDPIDASEVSLDRFTHDQDKRNQQIFTLSCLCQGCRRAPDVFLLRRVGSSLEYCRSHAISEDQAIPSAIQPAATLTLCDGQLRTRVQDLFERLVSEKQFDRLDTVITEGTRILEDRLRSTSGAPAETVGVELATYAFSPTSGRCRVSSVESEQQAVHMLFRGAFGFVRNPVHHRLMPTMDPVRAAQLLQFIDYLLTIIATATVGPPASSASSSS
jgi:hypothetical protein